MSTKEKEPDEPALVIQKENITSINIHLHRYQRQFLLNVVGGNNH